MYGKTSHVRPSALKDTVKSFMTSAVVIMINIVQGLTLPHAHNCIHTYMHTYIHTFVRMYIHTCLLLLISMLWHRQAIFKSNGDKLSSSAECRI